MKKFICIIIALSLVFASVLPVYAAFDSTDSQNLSLIKTYLQSFVSSWTTFFETGQGTISTLLTFQDLMRDIIAMADWLAPIFDYAGGLRPSSLMSIWDTLTSNLSALQVTNQLLTTGNSYLNQINTHVSLLNQQNYPFNSSNAGFWFIGTNGTKTLQRYDLHTNTWYEFVILYLAYTQQLLADQYNYRWSADLTHYNDTLSTWDSQQSTLTQINFTPESAIQGLYRYLAYTQRDVARLAFVLASDEEIETREKARANQTAVLDDFIDPTGDASLSTSDFGSMSDATDDFKTNFNTGVSGSNIWNVFDNSHYNWFTQQTRNALDTTQQTRGNDNYPTPLLDEYYNEILSLFGDSER